MPRFACVRRTASTKITRSSLQDGENLIFEPSHIVRVAVDFSADLRLVFPAPFLGFPVSRFSTPSIFHFSPIYHG